jgi:hypothetical protein
MLLAKGRITQDLIVMLSKWRHSGFQIFCGQRIFPQDETAMENLARYILRASFSQERMQYLAESSKVVYRAKDGSEEKVFDVLEWLAAMCSHIPDRGEQMVRYYGYYSNVSRGKRKETDDRVPSILEADKSSKEYRKNWARLIQKIYEVDPLTCPKCGGVMRILSFIQDRQVIQAILKHLGLWLVKLPRLLRPMPHLPGTGANQGRAKMKQGSRWPFDVYVQSKRGRQVHPACLYLSRSQRWLAACGIRCY